MSDDKFILEYEKYQKEKADGLWPVTDEEGLPSLILALKTKSEEFARKEKPYRLFNVYTSIVLPEHIRSSAISLLNKTLSKWHSWDTCKSSWETEKIDRFCRDLIEAIQREREDERIRDLAGIIGIIAKERYTADDGKWPELERSVEEWTESSSFIDQKKALLIVSSVAYDFTVDKRLTYPKMVGESVVKLVKDHLLNPDPTFPKEYAIKALRTLICYDRTSCSSLNELIKPLMDKFSKEGRGWTKDEQCCLFNCFDQLPLRPDVLDDHPDLFTSLISFFSTFCAKGVWRCKCEEWRVNAHIDDAYEHIVDLCEYYPIEDFLIPGIISVIMHDPINSIEGKPWPRNEDYEEMSFHCMVNSLKKVIKYLGKERTVPYLMAIAMDLLRHDNWRMRYAALMGLSILGEYGVKTFELITPLIGIVIRFLADSHPRVRFNAFSLLSSLNKPNYLPQREFQRAMDALRVNLSKQGWKLYKVTGMLTDFVRNCPEDIVATSYDSLMNFLKSVIQTTREEFPEYQYKSLRNDAFSTILLIGDKSDKEKFNLDFPEMFVNYVNDNTTHYTADTESRECFASCEKNSNVIIKKNCNRESCGSCKCPRPNWCVECLARIFLARVEDKALCPFCRVEFCVKDVHRIEMVDVIDL